MRSTLPALAVVALVVATGCVGTAPDGRVDAESPTPSDSPTPGERHSVEYVVGAGEVPGELRSVEVTLRVVFVETPEDFRRNRCWRSTFRGPYRPTITPIAPPEGDCVRSRTVTVDLTDLNGSRPLGAFSAPGRYSAGHALVVTDVSATDRNGTTVRRFRGADGDRAAVVEGPPNGTHRVDLRVHSRDEPTSGGALYTLASDRVDPSVAGSTAAGRSRRTA